MNNSDDWRYWNPVSIIRGSIEDLACHVYGERVLIVTTKGFVRRGLIKRIQSILATKKITVWDGVKPNPDLVDLDAAADILRLERFDYVLCLGGGSALDSGKALALLIQNDSSSSLRMIIDGKALVQPENKLPLLAIPTTSGTGAEVTPFATIWDHKRHKKHSISGSFVYPDQVLLDPTLTKTLGYEDTLFPALDAVSHSLESLWSKESNPISRAFAFEALQILSGSLLNLLKQPENINLRESVQTASVMAGLAISQTRTSIAHSISYPLTTHYGIPHGLACSFTLEALLELNIRSIVFTKHQYLLLADIKTMLSSLELSLYVKRHANRNEVLSLVGEMVTNGRFDNYSGEPIADIETILSKSLN